MCSVPQADTHKQQDLCLSAFRSPREWLSSGVLEITSTTLALEMDRKLGFLANEKGLIIRAIRNLRKKQKETVD